MSPWANGIPRGEYKKGMGARQRTANFKRALAGTTGKMTWANHNTLGFSSAAAGNTPPDISTSRGLMPTTVIQATQTLREMGLKWAACESPRFDVRDAVLNWEFLDQFGQYYEKVKEAAGRAWEYEQREAYFNQCDNKVILGVPESGTPTTPTASLTTGTGAATSFDTLTGYTLAQLNMTGGTPSGGVSSSHSTLNNGALQHFKAILDRLGAGKDSRIRGSDGAAYPLVCSPEQRFWLQHEPGIRSDIREGDAGSLLSAFGRKSFLGFQFIEDPEVPRFTLALNGATYDFTEVLPWTYQAGNLSTAISGAATHSSGTYTVLTVASTVGLSAGSAVRITPATASDEEYSDNFTVISVPSATTVVINKAWTDDMTGTLYTNNNGEVGWVRNSSYDIAPYEMSFILLPDVMEILTIDYPTTLGQGSEFAGAKPLGSFSWKNIENEDTNPDKSFGYFRGIFEYAPRPKKTEHGYAIMHRRAEPFTLSSPSLAMTTGLGWWA
jgi:hypothetical protein